MDLAPLLVKALPFFASRHARRGLAHLPRSIAIVARAFSGVMVVTFTNCNSYPTLFLTSYTIPTDTTYAHGLDSKGQAGQAMALYRHSDVTCIRRVELLSSSL